MMAFHGRVQDGDDVVGWWRCYPKPGLLHRTIGGEQEYDCLVEEYGQHGVSLKHEFTISHKPDDGTMVLAAKVMAYSAGLKAVGA